MTGKIQCNNCSYSFEPKSSDSIPKNCPYCNMPDTLEQIKRLIMSNSLFMIFSIKFFELIGIPLKTALIPCFVPRACLNKARLLPILQLYLRRLRRQQPALSLNPGSILRMPSPRRYPLRGKQQHQ